MISTLPSGTVIACENPDLTAELREIPQSSADFRPAGPAPETLADLLPLVDKASRRRWNKTFKLIVECQGKPAEEILLKYLFRRAVMDGFRPFLWDQGYLENTIVHHRKGLKHLRDLAASLGGEVEPVWKEAWREVMVQAEEHYCMVFAERFEAECESPADVSVEMVKNFMEELVRTRQKHMPGAIRAKCEFLLVLRKAGFVENQPIQAARYEDFGEPLEKLPEPMKSEVQDMREWSLKTEDDSEWELDWDSYDPAGEETYLALRRVTANRNVGSICRFYGWVKNVCHKEDGINSLEDLFREKIVRSYQKWLQKVRKHAGGSMRTTFSGMFSMLKSYPKTAHINLTWSTALIKSLPKTSQSKRNANKVERIVHFRTLEMIPGKIRKDLNILIARHKLAERAEQKRTTRKEGSFSEEKLEKARATRLLRMATLAQSEAIVKYLTTVVWRNENLRECRVNPDLSDRLITRVNGKNLEKPKKPNLWRGPVVPVPDMEIPDWAQKLIDDDPSVPLLQVFFDEDETKAGRAVAAVLPQTLVDITVEFVNTWRGILVEGIEDPCTLLVNQAGNSMDSQQLEWATEEATLRYGGEESRSVNPHLFRDIYAAAYLLDPEHYADYLTLSKILWHECSEVTVRTYSWIFNESVGTNAAGRFAEAREIRNRLREAGIQIDIQKQGTHGCIPAPPPSGFHRRQHETAPRRMR